MSVTANSRYPVQPDDDEELALDRLPAQGWRVAQAERAADVAGTAGFRREVTVAPGMTAAPVTPHPGVVAGISRGLGLLIRLSLLLILLAALWGMVTIINAGVRAPAALGEQIGGAIERGAGVVGAAGQRVVDAFDPAHPPRQALAQDAEIDELLRVAVGGPVSGSGTRAVTLASIQRQATPTGPDTAVYAVLHSELREPHETKVLGVTISSSRDPQDYYLYKGETVRIGQRLYKVNWVSAERQQMALVAYREQDRVTAPLKVDID
jgi:hypothetical protein